MRYATSINPVRVKGAIRKEIELLKLQRITLPSFCGCFFMMRVKAIVPKYITYYKKQTNN